MGKRLLDEWGEGGEEQEPVMLVRKKEKFFLRGGEGPAN